MPRVKPKTKAGKQRAVAGTMHEFKSGTLRSSSGDKVMDRDQAVAIAMHQAGFPPLKKKRTRKRRASTRKED